MLALSEQKNEILQRTSIYSVSPSKYQDSFMLTSIEKPLKIEIVRELGSGDKSDLESLQELSLPEKIIRTPQPLQHSELDFEDPSHVVLKIPNSEHETSF